MYIVGLNIRTEKETHENERLEQLVGNIILVRNINCSVGDDPLHPHSTHCCVPLPCGGTVSKEMIEWVELGFLLLVGMWLYVMAALISVLAVLIISQLAEIL